MQKHVNCGAFGSVDKITCHMLARLGLIVFNRKCTFRSRLISLNKQ